MQVANCIYLARKWEKDESIMRRQLKFFRDTKIIYQVPNLRIYLPLRRKYYDV